ncbi:hypothetical protein EYF80_050366 [Liparis tanakae]|uniref:Uncharacterized protein n=1 Tax=Liparis tanakae TaxID=230148 RepID=A0A4Z2FEU3_9TELE|nr:hypothetical protein EYF80_050366 [Liparis tanakae]
MLIRGRADELMKQKLIECINSEIVSFQSTGMTLSSESHIFSNQLLLPPRAPWGLSGCLKAQALEAVWAVKFKMHIEYAGALPTGDHIEVLSDSKLQLVARLPHI